MCCSSRLYLKCKRNNGVFDLCQNQPHKILGLAHQCQGLATKKTVQIWRQTKTLNRMFMFWKPFCLVVMPLQVLAFDLYRWFIWWFGDKPRPQIVCLCFEDLPAWLLCPCKLWHLICIDDLIWELWLKMSIIDLSCRNRNSVTASYTRCACTGLLRLCRNSAWELCHREIRHSELSVG